MFHGKKIKKRYFNATNYGEKNHKSILAEARMTDCNSLRISLEFPQNPEEILADT